VRANSAAVRSRQSLLATLFRHLDMVRLTAAASVLAMIGCTGLIDAPAPTKAEIARQLWVEKALPAMKASDVNCIGCHGGAAPRPMVEFLGAEGDDDLAIRDKIMAFDPAVVSLDAPQSSRLVNKGQHEGPPVVGQAKIDIIDWIQAEKEAANDTGPGGGGGTLTLRTGDITMLICTAGLPGAPTCPINEVPLDTLGEGAGVPGGKITFVTQIVGSGVYLNNLKLVPGPQGAFIEHPLFVSIPADDKSEAIADTIDRFFNTKLNLMTGAAPEQIGGGTAAFVNFPPQNKIAIYFKSAKIFQPEGPKPPAGGCKALTQFETAARNQLNTNCGNCHRGQVPGATSALNMTGVNAPNANDACNQVRLRTTLNDINNSAIFVAPAPNNPTHDFRFATQAALDAFKNALNPWIIAERDAP
jgi:mono/diheme cytochrome c family protein